MSRRAQTPKVIQRPLTGLLEESRIEPNSTQSPFLKHKFPNLILFRSIKNDIPLFFLFLIGSIATSSIFVFINEILNAMQQQLLSPLFSFTPIGGFLVLCMIVIYRRYNVRYLIADDGVKALRGFLSNHQIDAKLQYYQIRGTEIHRSFFGRLVGTGDLHIRGSSSDDTEVAFRGIHDPYRYQKLIQTRHREYANKAQNEQNFSI